MMFQVFMKIKNYNVVKSCHMDVIDLPIASSIINSAIEAPDDTVAVTAVS